MRLSRIHTSQALQSGEVVTLGDQESFYLLRVLRASTSDPVILFNGDGFDYPGEIIQVSKKSMKVQIREKTSLHNESPLKITLVQAISRGDRMDYCLQKATELGVFDIQLLMTNRVEARLKPDRIVKRIAHWKAVIRSACEQSGRASVPTLNAPLSLFQWLSSVGDGFCMVLDPQSASPLSRVSLSTEALSLLVGPEGGFDPEELRLLKKENIQPVSLGPRVLRTETAGPAAIAVLQSMAGDF